MVGGRGGRYGQFAGATAEYRTVVIVVVVVVVVLRGRLARREITQVGHGQRSGSRILAGAPGYARMVDRGRHRGGREKHPPCCLA